MKRQLNPPDKCRVVAARSLPPKRAFGASAYGYQHPARKPKVVSLRAERSPKTKHSVRSVFATLTPHWCEGCYSRKVGRLFSQRGITKIVNLRSAEGQIQNNRTNFVLKRPALLLGKAGRYVGARAED